jgi:hypothetical protein
MDSRKDQDSYTFSAIFTASKSDQIRIRNLFLDFLGEVRKISNDSPSEAALQMNFDLFKWF